MPHLAADSALSFHPGDIRSFDFPSGEFSHVIHCATTNARATFHNEDPLVKFDTIVAGTKHALDFAVKCRALKFIMTSSGSVYGKQPPDMNLVPEDYCGAPELSDMSSALGEGKRAAEFLCAYYSDRYGIETKIARCFSFVGPYMPLDIHYAIGNFIRDGLEGGPIRVTGDGRAYRSYLYAADLVIWLLRILVRGESKRAYNVGSEDSVSIGELAGIVAGYFGNKTGVSIAGAPDYSRPAGRYVPSTSRAQKELGLQQNISLTDAVKKTIAYYQPIF
jgi:dTDP-glucose 4,6-dehydratase